ncbi:MAG: hypothetical protein AAF705_16780, partial [Bacteroidota bacterium]
MFTRWNQQEVCPEKVKSLSKELGLSPYLCRILLQKGIQSPEEAQPFLDPQIHHLHHADQMASLVRFAKMLQQIQVKKSSIGLLVNTSIDSIIACVLLQEILATRGIAHQIYFSSLPEMIEQAQIIRIGFMAMPTDNQDWWVSPMCPSREEVNILSSKGESVYPYQDLSAAGLIYKLADYLSWNLDWPIEPNKMLELVALACAVDEFPMTGENRVMTHLGMQKIRTKPGEFFKKLIQLKFLGQSINTKTLQFKVGSLLQEMLYTNQETTIMNWISGKELNQIEDILQLIKLNRKVQFESVQTIFKEAERMVLQRHSRSKHCIVLYRPQWPKSALRKAAYKLADRFRRPCLLATQLKDGQIYAVIKSNIDLPLLNSLSEIADQFDSWLPGPACAVLSTQRNHLQMIANQLDNFIEKEIGEQLRTQEI